MAKPSNSQPSGINREHSKPAPRDLGTGGARKAADAIVSRNSRNADALKEAMKYNK